MGTREAPNYANIFMSKIDLSVKKCGIMNMNNLIYFYKRFIDDILVIWTGTFEQFLLFMDTFNQLHPTFKFTYSFNTVSRSTTFLGTEIKIVNNKFPQIYIRKKLTKFNTFYQHHAIQAMYVKTSYTHWHLNLSESAVTHKFLNKD